jgi:hypothetical protein
VRVTVRLAAGFLAVDIVRSRLAEGRTDVTGSWMLPQSSHRAASLIQRAFCPA